MTYMLKERDAEKRGEEIQAKSAAVELYKNNVPLDIIANSLHRSIDVIKSWVSAPSNAVEAK